MKLKTLIPTLSAALLSSAASQALGQTHDTGRSLVPSEVLKLSADTSRCGPFVFKELIVPYAGVVRVRWQARSDGSHNATSGAQSTIHTCTGVPVPNTSAAFQQGQCDLRVAAGDSVRVSATGTFDSNIANTSTACLRNVRLFFNVVNATGLGRVIRN